MARKKTETPAVQEPETVKEPEEITEEKKEKPAAAKAGKEFTFTEVMCVREKPDHKAALTDRTVYKMETVKPEAVETSKDGSTWLKIDGGYVCAATSETAYTI